MPRAIDPRPTRDDRADSARARSTTAKPGISGRAAAAAQSDTALVTTTLRLDPATRRGLELLQGALGTTLNGLMNEGLAIYVAQRTAALERDVQANLDRIKRYRKTDPTFSKAFAAIAAEEAAHRDEDPVEGVPFREQAGPAVHAVRRMIFGRR